MDRERIYTFDIVKGIAIIFLIPMHALIYQIGKNDPSLFAPLISAVPEEVLYMLAPVIVLSLWGPIFTLITGANIAYGFLRVYERDPNQSSAYILRRVLSAILLILISRIAVFIFEGGMFENGSFSLLNFKIRYYADTLDSIAFTGIIVPVFILFIINKIKGKKSANGEANIVQPRHIYIGLAIITLIWFVFTPVVHAVKPYVFDALTKHDWKLLLMMFGKMTMGRFRFFPILGFGYVGAIIGAAIHNKEKFRKMRQTAVLFSGVTLVFFLLWCLLSENPLGNIVSDDIPIMVQVMNLGAMTFATVLMLGHYDFCRPEQRRRRVEKTLAVRRFSIVSLTIYITECFVAQGVYLIFEHYWETAISFVNQIPVLVWGGTQIFVFIMVIWLIWIIIVHLWEKIDFIFSLEWFTIKAAALLLGHKNVRINSHKILYGK
ncbi:MAG: hypothetical protein PHW79_06605 [Candidatus Marinimicrobia bacterium]|nr:hypothetical protein [Candidatus Neomarinimicrobiota bacterium]